MTARQAYLTAPRTLEFRSVELDGEKLAADAVHAETEFSAVSVGTERAAWVGEPPLRPGPIYPRLVGYCNCARVVRVGTGVTGIRPGERILTHQSHQSAFVTREAEVLAKVPDQVASRTASLSYLAQLGLAALQKAGFRAGERVAVLGLGVIGLAAVALARAVGARVAAVGNHPARLKLAAELGAEVTWEPTDESISAAAADVVITTVNGWDGWRTALALARTDGRIAVLGFPGRTSGPPSFNPLDPALFYGKQLTVVAAGLPPASPWEFSDPAATARKNLALVVELVRRGALPLERLITDEVPWRALPAIYERAAAGDKSLIAAVLDWRLP